MSIFCNSGHVVHEHDVVFVAPRTYLFQVFKRNRLAACHVDASRDADVRDLVFSDFIDQCIQFVEVDVAFERMLRLSVVGIIDDDVHKCCASQLLVQASRREVHVARYIVTWRDQDLAQDIFCAPALVTGNRIAVAVVLFDRVPQMIKIPATGVRLIAHHDARPLAITHRTNARIGQQIDINIFGTQQERVVARFSNGRQTVFPAGHLDQLNHLDFVGFGPGLSIHESASIVITVAFHPSPVLAGQVA